MRVTSFRSLLRNKPPVCVVQLAGAQVEATLDDVRKSRHRVMNVVHLVPGADRQALTT